MDFFTRNIEDTLIGDISSLFPIVQQVVGGTGIVVYGGRLIGNIASRAFYASGCSCIPKHKNHPEIFIDDNRNARSKYLYRLILNFGRTIPLGGSILSGVRLKKWFG